MMEEPLYRIDVRDGIDVVKRGKLFVFEGVDGSGKTTVLNDVAKLLEVWGYHVTKLREPTRETRSSDKALEMIHDATIDKTDPEVKERLRELYTADRIFNITHNIKPALDKGRVVLLDRYFHSTAIYQADTEKNMESILLYNRETISAPEPTVTFILVHLPAVVMQRLKARDITDPYIEKVPQLIKDYENLMIYDEKGCYVEVFNNNRLLCALSVANIIKVISNNDYRTM